MDELMNKAIVELELDDDAYEYFMRNAAFEIVTGQYDPNEKESMDLEEGDNPCTNVCDGMPNNDQITQIGGIADDEPLTLDRLKSECMTSSSFSGTELNIDCGNHLMALEQRRIARNRILAASGIVTD